MGQTQIRQGGIHVLFRILKGLELARVLNFRERVAVLENALVAASATLRRTLARIEAEEGHYESSETERERI